MNENAEGFVPPGFRFHPTEEELVGYYLKKKINSQKIDLDVIIDIDLYRMEPCQIQEKCSKLGNEEENEWYFFSYKDRKYPSGTRTNRATSTGFWKATGRDKSVLSNDKIIGMRKTLVFYNGRAPNGRKTDWIIHEYRLQTNHHSPPQEEGWVVCRAFKKPTPSHNNKKLGTNWNNNHHYNNYYPITNTNNNPNNYNNNIRNTTLIMDGSPLSLQLDTRNSSSFEGGSSTSSTTLKTRHVSHELTSINNSTSVINMMDFSDELDSPSFSRSMSTKNESFNQEKISYCGGLMSSNIEAYEQEKNNDDDNKWEIVDSFLGLHQVGDEIRATTSWFSDHNLPNLQSYDELEAHNITFFLGGCPNL